MACTDVSSICSDGYDTLFGFWQDAHNLDVKGKTTERSKGPFSDSSSSFKQYYSERFKGKVNCCIMVEIGQLCMMKNQTSNLHLKRLYFHHVIEGTSFEDHVVGFKEIVADFETLKVKYDEENLVLILLCLLPALYMLF